jgi:pimeloyl-ACP methyl ester carboxylesterase/1-acyl-sn-glycerol-3-phosphate acyltransferase
LTSIFSQEYADLEQPGALHLQVSRTLRFSFVTPPWNGTSTWRNPNNAPSELLSDPSEGGNSTLSKKPAALYLPGLDGYGISAHQYQFDDLATSFNFWRLTIDGEDRSDFLSVITAVADFVRELSANTSAPVTLIGESCGGLLAAATALKLQQQSNGSSPNEVLKGLVLVNPATSFDQTNWDRLVPVLTSLQYLEAATHSPPRTLTPYGVVGSLTLSAIIPDNDQYRRILDLIVNLPTLNIPPSSQQQLESVWNATASGFLETERRLPPSLLLHRVANWLVPNAGVVRRRLKSLQVFTLVVAGQQDKLLPSRSEAQHLEGIIPKCETLVVPNRGHFVLDQNVNLTEAILYSSIDPMNRRVKVKPYDPILDWKLPTHDKIVATIQNSTSTSRTLHSPVFFSSDGSGRRTMGLGWLPKTSTTRPLLFVGNHQFAALDMRMLVAELYEKRRVFPRGLAHPITFAFTKDLPIELDRRKPGILDDGSRRTNPFNGDFEEFGAVEVSPKNYYRLMQSGQDAILFPGGAKEALSSRTDYPLMWPNKTDFVRTAAKFNAVVVPVSAVGMIDSVRVLFEPHQLAENPFLGEYVRAFNSNLSAARYDESRSNSTEGQDILGFPIAVPKLPARNYFLFGKPFDLANVDHMDKQECQKVYLEIQAEVRRGLDDLTRARGHDPFSDPLKRFAFERIFDKAAPTFPIDELNKV